MNDKTPLYLFLGMGLMIFFYSLGWMLYDLPKERTKQLQIQLQIEQLKHK